MHPLPRWRGIRTTGGPSPPGVCAPAVHKTNWGQPETSRRRAETSRRPTETNRDQPETNRDQPAVVGSARGVTTGWRTASKRRCADVATGRRTSRCQGRGIGTERTNGRWTPGEVRSQRGGPGIGTERTSRRRTPGEVSCGGAVPGRDRPDERPVAAGAAREPQGPGPGGRDCPDERPVAWPRGERDRSGDRVRDGSGRGAACAADHGHRSRPRSSPGRSPSAVVTRGGPLGWCPTRSPPGVVTGGGGERRLRHLGRAGLVPGTGAA
jgi:hypothetical protein